MMMICTTRSASLQLLNTRNTCISRQEHTMCVCVCVYVCDQPDSSQDSATLPIQSPAVSSHQPNPMFTFTRQKHPKRATTKASAPPPPIVGNQHRFYLGQSQHHYQNLLHTVPPFLLTPVRGCSALSSYHSSSSQPKPHDALDTLVAHFLLAFRGQGSVSGFDEIWVEIVPWH